jgi:hypothetical protein
LGAVAKFGAKAIGKAAKNIYSDPEITRGFIDWGDAVDYADNPGFNPRLYERAVKSNYVPPTTDPSLKPFLTHKDFKKGGAIVDRRGQWAHPGKNVTVPTEDGHITMKGVPYLVFGQDENGFGQLMMPGGEYKFTGKSVHEKPLDMFTYEMAYGGQPVPQADNTRVAKKPMAFTKQKYPSTEEQAWNMVKSMPKLFWEKLNVDMPGYVYGKIARLGEMAGLTPNQEWFPGDAGQKLTGAQLELKRLDDLQYKGGGTFSGNLFYQDGGPLVGDEMEVTPEQLEELRNLGYQFEII